MFAAAALVLALDHTSKAMVAARIPEGVVSSRNVLGVRLNHVLNRRTPWGSRKAVLAMAVIWLLSTAAAAIVVATLVRDPLTHVALGGLVGGASGNLIDALSRGAVTDFIDLRVWPIFNIADAAIVTGAVLLVSNVL